MYLQIAVKNWKKNRGPIKRSKLAYEIARRVKQFLDTTAVSHDTPPAIPVLKDETTGTLHKTIHKSTMDDWGGSHEARKDVPGQVHMGV